MDRLSPKLDVRPSGLREELSPPDVPYRVILELGEYILGEEEGRSTDRERSVEVIPEEEYGRMVGAEEDFPPSNRDS